MHTGDMNDSIKPCYGFSGYTGPSARHFFPDALIMSRYGFLGQQYDRIVLNLARAGFLAR